MKNQGLTQFATTICNKSKIILPTTLQASPSLIQYQKCMGKLAVSKYRGWTLLDERKTEFKNIIVCKT